MSIIICHASKYVSKYFWNRQKNFILQLLEINWIITVPKKSYNKQDIPGDT